MNLGQMVDSVYTHVQDSSRTYIQEDSVISWINQGLADLDARLRYTRAQTTGTTTGGTIPFPAGLVEVLSLILGGSIDPVSFVSDDDFDSYALPGGNPAVTIARVWGSGIELYPAPGDGTAYTLRFVREPDPLVANSDIPTLPLSLHRKLVLFGAAEALWQDGNFQLADRKRQDYESALPDPPLHHVRLEPGPYTITIEPGPFDSDNQAAHL